MAETEPKRAQQFAAKEVQDGLGVVLDHDASNADEAGEDNRILAADLVRDKTCRKGRDKDANSRSSVEDLLVLGCNEQSPVDDLSELLHKGHHGEEVSDVVDLKAKVDGQKKDEEA